jgi:hypothetical protein
MEQGSYYKCDIVTQMMSLMFHVGSLQSSCENATGHSPHLGDYSTSSHAK